jgi:hypothetical protein
VSNFAPEHISRLVAETGVAPAINQIECHPYFQQPAASAFHVEQGIVTEAWSPIARGGKLLRDERVVAIAARYKQTPAPPGRAVIGPARARTGRTIAKRCGSLGAMAGAIERPCQAVVWLIA